MPVTRFGSPPTTAIGTDEDAGPEPGGPIDRAENIILVACTATATKANHGMRRKSFSGCVTAEADASNQGNPPDHLL